MFGVRVGFQRAYNVRSLLWILNVLICVIGICYELVVIYNELIRLDFFDEVGLLIRTRKVSQRIVFVSRYRMIICCLAWNNLW